MILGGEIAAGRIMLRDYINATGAMDEICQKVDKHKSGFVPLVNNAPNAPAKSADLSAIRLG